MYGQLPEMHLDGQIVKGITITLRNPGHDKTAVVGLPTEDQLAAYLNSKKLLRWDLGRGKSKTTFVNNRKAEHQLFRQIRLDSGLPFDEYEISYVITKVLHHEHAECKKRGDNYEITLQTLFGDVVHQLRVPSGNEVHRYCRTFSTSTEMPHGLREIRTHAGAGCTLYDACVVGIQGYDASYTTSSVPAHHKCAAVLALVDALDVDAAA
jgi:hypothetical protein